MSHHSGVCGTRNCHVRNHHRPAGRQAAMEVMTAAWPAAQPGCTDHTGACTVSVAVPTGPRLWAGV